MMREITLDLAKVHRLGQRAFVLFLTRRLRPALAVGALVLGAWWIRPLVPSDYAHAADVTFRGGLLIFAAVFLVQLIKTYLEYRSHSYFFDEEFFQVTHGYVVRNEVAIVYHQVQNALIKRDMLDRMLGISRLIISMAGDQGTGRTVLPGLDRRKAKLIQQELMRQARVHSFKPASAVSAPFFRAAPAADEDLSPDEE